ncbi:hypothetical protein ABL78_6465 [Leptomonas seymouri]|uniref:Uncharacterized protein n=1 Tax=Leptomonas seymouri TaxID=5684 RepID=A0A0N0P467_LEPSE|nr:hypothetical protein ABL78_6465 [Leptomonas seymouri]|eukprot:KPI84477.1 hypothetical protein ABL78_6465 [Leptomonas seymouri]
MPLQLLIGCRRNRVLWREVQPALTCACRLAHVGPHPGIQAPLSPQAIKLRRAMWMRMHPVERWTTLVDLGRRGAYLIEKAHAPAMAEAASTQSSPLSSSSSGATLGSSDDRVQFSEAATAAHHQLCAALPYPARLHLCLSLLMWVRCLRDVQDTLARVRLPFAMVRRLERYTIADVFPTRLSEYWVDVHTTVATKMSPLLNSTAEQVPAPHTWDAETSETMEDAATESTITLDAGRVLHGRPRQLRLSGKALLRQVQGMQPRASADDEVAARLTEVGSEGGRQRRRRRWLLKGDASAARAGPSALSAEASAAADAFKKRRCISLEFQADACRCVPPVSLETQPVEDALYHGNARRGEGCPMSEDGASTPNPIFIHVPPPGVDSSGYRGAEAEVLQRHCVMAHAAILSSLYIEGRVVDFSTNNAIIAAYVQWLWEDLISDQYLSVSLIDAEAAEAKSYRPYFPAWCWRNVLVLLPAKESRSSSVQGCRAASYSTSLINTWAVRIAQAAPCTVIVEGGESATAAYVQQLKNEVERVQRRNAYTDFSDSFASPQQASSKTSVEWVPIITKDTVTDTQPYSSESPASTASVNANHNQSPAPFQPRRAATPKRSSLSAAAVGFHLLSRLKGAQTDDSNGAGFAVAATERHGSRQQRFLQAVLETLRDRFYTCEFLYSPTQSCLTPYRFERWVWEQLPGNVRVIGINTAPLDVLYYFPQGVFLTQKVGNAFRYRAVERTVVAKDSVPSWSSHPLRHTATQLKRLSRRWWQRHGGCVAGGLHAELSLLDQREIHRCASEQRAETKATPPLSSGISPRGACAKALQDNALAKGGREIASDALVRERTVEYLAEPSKWSLLGLATARFFRV